MHEQGPTIDPRTLTRGMTYLYRWWLQKELNIVPESYIRHKGQSTLVCPDWVLTGSVKPVEADEVSHLKIDLKRPVYVICPALPTDLAGFDLDNHQSCNLCEQVNRIIEVLQERQQFLYLIGEENQSRDEWWQTQDAGEFRVWKAAVSRLLLYPTNGSVYGFSIRQSTEEGYFFFRSRSCKEQGHIIKEGLFKMSNHALPTQRKVNNLDLLFSDGSVLLLRLLPTGAGFKVFPRRVPGFEGSLE